MRSGKLPIGRAEAIVNQVFGAMSESLIRGDSIELRASVRSQFRDCPAYQGRNPRNGESVQVKAKRLPFFRVGKELRARVDAPRKRDTVADRSPAYATKRQAYERNFSRR